MDCKSPLVNIQGPMNGMHVALVHSIVYVVSNFRVLKVCIL